MPGIVSILLIFAFQFGVFGCDTSCNYSATTYQGKTIGYYDGNVSKTITGVTCCPWTSSDEATEQVAGTNYCRSMGTDIQMRCMVDCLTPAPSRPWQYCDVGTFDCPICSNPEEPYYPPETLSYPCIAPQATTNTQSAFDPRIVGGQEAVPYEFPFYAFIRNDGSLWCGGTLVHKDWVLTAQHCVADLTNAQVMAKFSIWIGFHSPSDPLTSTCRESRRVVQVIRAPGFVDLDSGALDMAFLKLDTSSNYPPIVLYYPELVTEDLEAAGLMTMIIGFGTTSSGGYSSTYLRKSLVPNWLHSSCDTSYGGDITDNELCAGYRGGTVDTCQGDSGGPLFVKRGTTFIQMGVTSWGDGCAKANTPGVYARVSQSQTWICSEPDLLPMCQGTLAPTLPPSPPLTWPQTDEPTRKPTTATPTRTPTREPTERPTRQPTQTPTSKPTRGPTVPPTSKSPTSKPTRMPTMAPVTRVPTEHPTRRPTKSPTSKPTRTPTKAPVTRVPTEHPTRRPTKSPTSKPTRTPTKAPVTRVPTEQPTRRPTKSPTSKPTRRPSYEPTARPTRIPSNHPSKKPTRSPSFRPSKKPTYIPTARPSRLPTIAPSQKPTKSPTQRPTRAPNF